MRRCPPTEETLACYLSMDETLSYKAPSLPSRHLQVKCLNGKAYATAGQAVASLHTMAILQAYQADVLKDLHKGQGLSPDEVARLRRTTDLDLAQVSARTTRGSLPVSVYGPEAAPPPPAGGRGVRGKI